WVMAASMAMVQRLFPDLNVGPTLQAYLAEGFDLDVEGFYIEHSAAIYDAFCDRSLLLLADYADMPSARETANANLATDLYLFDADGKIESGLSRRQDVSSRQLPLGLASVYLYSALTTPNPQFLQVARFLWNAAPPVQQDCFYLALVLLRHGDLPEADAPLPDRFTHHFPNNGLWRVRRGPLSASFFANMTRLFNLRHGAAELASVKISQTYFGVGEFVGEALTTDGDTACLHSSGVRQPRRPGYEAPLGKPVPPERYQEMLSERELLRLPPAESELAIQALDDGFDIHYRTLDGFPGVTTQVAFDFVPGGVWETDDTAFTPQPGAVIFLKHGYGAMRYGTDVIEIGPGADAHRMNPMRDAEAAPNHVRVLVTFFTPIDHLFRIRTYSDIMLHRRETP
ncbi:MAG TPA: hypothetical protein VKU00_26140, partial [Chthonomonadaceae bacterium]|nr:hypothetical protein [Chthonomonadaceae bacterium]